MMRHFLFGWQKSLMSDPLNSLNMLVIGGEMNSKKLGVGIKSHLKQNKESIMFGSRTVSPPLMVEMGATRLTSLKDSISKIWQPQQ